MRSLTTSTILSLAFLVNKVESVVHGFEQYINNPGVFWAFGSAGVTIVDPTATQAVIKNFSITTTKWGDTTYLRDQAQIKHYLFANDYANDRVAVFDTNTQELQVLVSLPAGSKPLHLYAVYYYDQVWVHDDGTGSFDVFRAAQVRYRGTSGVRASSIGVGHTNFYFNFRFMKKNTF